MKLIFSGQGRYPEYDEGFDLYRKRAKKENTLDRKQYARVIRRYCELLSERLCKEGMVDLPNGMGTIAAAIITRKPQYRGGKFIGYGAKDYKTGELDGNLKTFGMVFLPRHDKNENLRCLGYVANRQLFKRMKGLFMNGDCDWAPIGFKDEMI